VIRGILSNVRVQGLAPCTEDTVLKQDFALLGTAHDMLARVTLARAYTSSLESSVRKARDLIYKKGYSLKYRGVEELLKAQSLAPTQVSLTARWTWPL
jgi:hypothetical protein